MLKKIILLASVLTPITCVLSQEEAHTTTGRVLDLVSHDQNVQDIITGYLDYWHHLKQAPFRNFREATNNLQFLPGLPILTVSNNNIIITYNITQNDDDIIKSAITIDRPALDNFLGFNIRHEGSMSLWEGNDVKQITKSVDTLTITSAHQFFVAIAHSKQYNLLALSGHAYKPSIQLFQSPSPKQSLQSILLLFPAKIHDLITDYVLHPIEIFKVKKTVFSLAVSPNGQYLASGDLNGSLGLYNLANRACAWNKSDSPVINTEDQSIEKHTSTVYALAIHNNKIYSASHDGTIQMWDMLTGKHLGQIGETLLSPIISLAISSDGRYLAAGSSEETIEIYANLGAQLKKYTGK